MKKRIKSIFENVWTKPEIWESAKKKENDSLRTRHKMKFMVKIHESRKIQRETDRSSSERWESRKKLEIRHPPLETNTIS